MNMEVCVQKTRVLGPFYYLLRTYVEDICVTLPEPHREKVTYLLTAHPVFLLQKSSCSLAQSDEARVFVICLLRCLVLISI